MKTLKITAKCSDMFGATLLEKGDGIESIKGEYNGYVPGWFPNPEQNHYGDYVELEINLETGEILNWKKPSASQLRETFVKGL